MYFRSLFLPTKLLIEPKMGIQLASALLSIVALVQFCGTSPYSETCRAVAIYASVYCLTTSYQAAPDFLDFITSIDNRQLPRGQLDKPWIAMNFFPPLSSAIRTLLLLKLSSHLNNFTDEMQNKKSIFRTSIDKILQHELGTHRFTRSQLDSGASLNILALIIK